MANGAIDRFRKSLEKLMFPLSKARHQSVSKATHSFLHNLPSSSTSLPDPKLLLQQAQHATMGSVREAVINDVQRIAVSAQAADLRNSLRRAFDQIVHPRRDRPVGEKRVTEPCDSMPNEQNKTTSAITPSHSAKLPDVDRPVASDTQVPASVEQKSQSKQSKLSPLPPPRQQKVPLGINPSNSESSAQQSKEQRREPADMQSIPTDLFQTAHRILQSKEKAQKEGLASAHQGEANETPQIDKSEVRSEGEHENESVHSKLVVEQEQTSKRERTKQDKGLMEYKSGAGARKEEQENLGNQNHSSAEKDQQKFENHNESITEGQTRNVNYNTRLSSKATKKYGAKKSVDEKQTRALEHDTEKDSKHPSRADDMVKKLDTKSSQVIDSKDERGSKKEGRGRRKAQSKPAELDTTIKKRRKKSRRGDNDNFEAEEAPGSKPERYEPESAGNTEKKPRRKQGRNTASRKKNVEQVTEKATPKKRAKPVEETHTSSLSPLVDPRNPNRPRGYRVTAPFCVPEDYDEQLKVLQVLENLLEKEFADPFSEPVDPGEEGCSAYLREIANPMDLGTIVKRLKEGSEERGYFKTVQEVIADIELVWWNCTAFNGAFDPVVFDMDRCKLELSLQFEQFEQFGVTCKQPRKQRRTPKTRNRYRGYSAEKESTEVGVLKNSVSTSDGEQRNQFPPPESDLNDGQLLGKHGLIFRYVAIADVGRKVWSSCSVADYNASNRSYTIKWDDDGSTTENATLGPGCMFNIHRFRTS